MTKFFKDATGSPLGGFDSVSDVRDEKGEFVVVPLSIPVGAVEITQAEYELLMAPFATP